MSTPTPPPRVPGGVASGAQEPLCSEQCSSAGQIPRAPTTFFKSATIAFKFSCYKIDFWFLGAGSKD
jgi:hypothetical protein